MYFNFFSTFIPNLEKLNEIIIENTIRRDKEITEEVIEGYNFNLLMEDVYVFKMTATDINTIVKTASIVSATMLNIVSDNGKVMLSINDPKNSTSHSYKKALGDSEQSFNVKMAIDSFKVVPGDYTVRVSNAIAKSGKVLVFFFESSNSDLTYLIAADSTSKV